MKKLLLLFFAFVFSNHIIQAQNSTGYINGNVSDSILSPIPFATITLMKNGQVITGVSADIDGNYILMSIPANEYDVRVTAVGYKESTLGGHQSKWK